MILERHTDTMPFVSAIMGEEEKQKSRPAESDSDFDSDEEVSDTLIHYE